jgi:hypothetical protein
MWDSQTFPVLRPPTMITAFLSRVEVHCLHEGWELNGRSWALFYVAVYYTLGNENYLQKTQYINTHALFSRSSHVICARRGDHESLVYVAPRCIYINEASFERVRSGTV